MTTAQYVPIIKGKASDLKAVGRLDPKLRAVTKPLIEALPVNSKKRTLDRHVFTLCDHIRKHVPLGEVFVDFYGIMPDAAMPDGTNAVLFGYQLLKGLGRSVTPVFGLETIALRYRPWACFWMHMLVRRLEAPNLRLRGSVGMSEGQANRFWTA